VSEGKNLIYLEIYDNCNNVVLQETLSKEIRLANVYNIKEPVRVKDNILLTVKEFYVSDKVIENTTLFEPSYEIYYSREGFKFVIIKYSEKNIGTRKIWGYGGSSYLITEDNNVYESYYFSDLRRVGCKVKEVNSLSFELLKHLCGGVIGTLYPDEEKSECVFFEIRENEVPKYFVLGEYIFLLKGE